MVRWFGKRFEIGWDVRDAYAGQPFLSGGQVFHLPFMSHYDQTHGIPYYLRLAAPVTIPFTERGTYWVRVRYRWSKEDKSPLPDMVEEREYRLFIYRGAAPRPHAPLPADAALSHTTIRIAADRPSLIYGPRERLAVKVAFWPPPAGVTNAFFHVEARSASDGETVKRVEGTPQWVTSRPFVAELDLSDQPAGPYRIRATMRSGDRVFDELERLVGRQGPPPPALTVRRRGAVPSYQELLGRPAKAVDAPCTAEPQSALRKGVPPHDPAAAHPTDARDPGPCALPGRRGRPLARRPCCGRAGAHPARRQDGRTARH
jgi:hypothetical protein